MIRTTRGTVVDDERRRAVMRVVTDTERCIGAGQCVLTDPTVFDQSDDDGTVVLLTEHVEGERVDTVREAVDMCPNQAISVADD
jgi:ferredoxin